MTCLCRRSNREFLHSHRPSYKACGSATTEKGKLIIQSISIISLPVHIAFALVLTSARFKINLNSHLSCNTIDEDVRLIVLLPPPPFEIDSPQFGEIESFRRRVGQIFAIEISYHTFRWMSLKRN